MIPARARTLLPAPVGGPGLPAGRRGRRLGIENGKRPNPVATSECLPRRRLRAPALAVTLTLAVLLVVTTVACGYHTAGQASTLPTEIKTIAVPAFVNHTETYKVEQMLTAAVVREITTRTHYHVVNQISDDADATLRGTVLSTYSAPLTFDSHTGRVASVLITVNMKVVFTDRRGKVLYQNSAYVFREQYEVSTELNSFFEEDSPALERLARDFARTLISNILEGF